MKRLVVWAACCAGFVLSAVSCSTANHAKLVNTATWQKLNFQPYVTPVQVDLAVSPQKIEYFMLVSEIVRRGGYDNVVATAVKEALESKGGGDVIVGLQSQVKYNEKGEIESVSISGFPASYVNFRSNENLPAVKPEEPLTNKGMSILGGITK